MEYMLIINTSPDVVPHDPSSPDFQEQMGAWMAYNQRLIDGGHWVSGASLKPGSTASVVRTGASPVITDGPFAETKEQVGGYYLISATDLDQALELAAAIPLEDAVVEVRPVMFRPDAPQQ